MLQIRLLVQFDIRLDKKRVIIPSRIGQSLFVYLALSAGASHRREKLAGTFWPDTSDENARKNLRQELWRVRKALSAQQNGAGDYLLADEYTITLNRGSEFWLDAAQLERPELDLESLTGHAGPVLSVRFSPDGKRPATSGVDGTVRVYLLDIQDLVALAKSRLTRSLTTGECRQHLHVDQCP